MTKENLYDWLFNYSPYINKWRAAKREDASLLFSNINSPKILVANTHAVLEEIIMKTNGDPEMIKKLIK